MRLIDADELLKKLLVIEREYKFYAKYSELTKSDEDWYKGKINAFTQITSLIENKNEVPTVEERPKAKWIPVSERLPEKFKDVLCWAKSTARGGDICFVGSCDNGCWFLQSSAGHQSYPTQYEVVAWMELPKPYKEDMKGK